MNPEYTKAESFRKNGFIVIPDLLSPQEVSSVRETIRSIIRDAPPDKRMLTTGDILGNEALSATVAAIQFSARLLEKLTAIIPGEISYINNLNLQCNMFGVGSWHTDCGSEIDNTNRYLYDPDYLFGKVGVYLQDNTAQFGGGINVIRKSHKIFEQARLAGKLGFLYSRLLGRMELSLLRLHKKKAFLVPNKAGSAVFFDSRLLHCSTTPQALDLNARQKAAQRLPGDLLDDAHAKYVLYWEACAKKYSDAFLQNSCKRAVTEEIGIRWSGANEYFFTEYLGYHYPSDYPPSYVDRCSRQSSLSIACPDKQIADFWKTAWDLKKR
jgi:hypothetical protein